MLKYVKLTQTNQNNNRLNVSRTINKYRSQLIKY